MSQVSLPTKIERVHHQLVPRAVRKMIQSLQEKRKNDPLYGHRQRNIHAAREQAEQAESLDSLRDALLDSQRFGDLEESHRAFGWAKNYALEGDHRFADAADDLDLARRVLAWWDDHIHEER